jgi:hypothetical protein
MDFLRNPHFSKNLGKWNCNWLSLLPFIFFAFSFLVNAYLVSIKLLDMSLILCIILLKVFNMYSTVCTYEWYIEDKTINAYLSIKFLDMCLILSAVLFKVVWTLQYLINIWQMSWQSHTLHHDQTKHPTENFISQILSKIH